MWIGDKITEKGLGNGSSIIIFIGIVSGIPKDIINNDIGCKYKKVDSIIDDIDENYKYYSRLYFEFFGKKAFIANPGGSKEQTIDAIKKSLIEQKDLLDEILNSNEQNIYY